MTILIPNQLPNVIQNFIDKSHQIQQAGFDLTVQSIEKIVEEGLLARENSDRIIPKTEKIALQNQLFNLQPGGYILRYNESVHVPKSAAGLTLPRSSLMRLGATLHSALWDPGYEGVGMGLLTVSHPIQIQKDARVAQIIFFKLSKEVIEGYTGQYQNEGLTNEQ